MYMTRLLSFAGVTFDIKELPLSLDFIEMYNGSVKLVSGTCVNRDGFNSFLLSIIIFFTCNAVNLWIITVFCKIIMDINYFVVVVVVLLFSKIPREIMLQYLVELYFMYTVD